MEIEFNPSEAEKYDDYFSLYFKEKIENNSNNNTYYKQHLQTATKDKIIDLAIEGHSLYKKANDLVLEKNLEIENLNNKISTEVSSAQYNTAMYRQRANNYKLLSIVTIVICILAISAFYIYQAIKYKLEKYANKIRQETIDDMQSKNEEW